MCVDFILNLLIIVHYGYCDCMIYYLWIVLHTKFFIDCLVT
jgi:hypothetical protein